MRAAGQAPGPRTGAVTIGDTRTEVINAVVSFTAVFAVWHLSLSFIVYRPAASDRPGLSAAKKRSAPSGMCREPAMRPQRIGCGNARINSPSRLPHRKRNGPGGQVWRPPGP